MVAVEIGDRVGEHGQQQHREQDAGADDRPPAAAVPAQDVDAADDRAQGDGDGAEIHLVGHGGDRVVDRAGDLGQGDQPRAGERESQQPQRDSDDEDIEAPVMVVSHHAAVEWVMPVWMASPAQAAASRGPAARFLAVVGDGFWGVDDRQEIVLERDAVGVVQAGPAQRRGAAGGRGRGCAG